MTSDTSMSNRVLFVSHGGGPLPLLGDPAHAELVRILQDVPTEFTRPSAIVVISAHWESRTIAITANPHPALIYDYYGFPPESYRLKYPAPGDATLANALANCLTQAGLPVELDEQRGFDHGLFVPLLLMYPEANIPCVQVSLHASLEAEVHLRLGEALATLPASNVLFIGSGFTFHNMKAFFAPDTAQSMAMNQAFESWLIETCTSQALEETQRRNRLVDWQNAPHARYCHPREEHLLPLHVCYGLTRKPCSQHYAFDILNKRASMYLW